MKELRPSRLHARTQFKNDFHVLDSAKHKVTSFFSTKHIKVFLRPHSVSIEIFRLVVRSWELYRMRQSPVGRRQPVFRNWKLLRIELDELCLTPIPWFKLQGVAASISGFVAILRIAWIQVGAALLALAMPIDI